MEYRIVVLYILLISFQTSYIWWLPSIPVYPNSRRESQLVMEQMTHSQLFHETDQNVAVAFIDVLQGEDPRMIEWVSQQEDARILFLKYLFNRPRPHQVNPDIIPSKSNTTDSPSYPSGHSYQAFLIAREYSRKYPHLKDKLYVIAERCGRARIYAGLHYPSDHEFSRWLVVPGEASRI